MSTDSGTMEFDGEPQFTAVERRNIRRTQAQVARVIWLLRYVLPWAASALLGLGYLLTHWTP